MARLDMSLRQTFRPALVITLVAAFLLQIVHGFRSTPVRRQDMEPTQNPVTAVSGCHLHDTSVFCMAGTTEYLVKTTATATSDVPSSFTGCHNHGPDTYCLTEDNEDIEVILATDIDSHADIEAEEDDGDSNTPEERHCHFHAGIEHCVGGSESTSESPETQCEKVDRDYKIPLRVGLLFAILIASAIGVFGPIILHVYLSQRFSLLAAMLRQFGTGVVISTAFVHLFTHASLMFENPCLGELSYEGTAAAFLMAGLFLSFVVEYFSHRLAVWYRSRTGSRGRYNPSMVSIMVLEAGIIFHSLLIGLTLVVAGDGFLITLFIVILFHQMFEGVALGTRIAALGTYPEDCADTVGHGHEHHHSHALAFSPKQDHKSSHKADIPTPVPMTRKLLLATGFALVTPTGMAIGIGVLHQFNGNDPATIWAIGALDAVSAGILVWVGVVEMWAGDWMLGGDMTTASPLRAGFGLTFLVAGMIVMSLLGKWA